MATGLARKLWSIEEYERMIEQGILTKDNRVELIRGEIVEMAPIGLRHAACVSRLEEIFHEMLGRRVNVSVQNPIMLPNNSEPEPDLALFKRREDHYESRRPTEHDALLVVEVTDSALVTDRMDKVPLYAEAGISEVWLVNLDEGVLEVYADPIAGVYSERRRALQGEELTLPRELHGKISVDEVLGLDPK